MIFMTSRVIRVVRNKTHNKTKHHIGIRTFGGGMSRKMHPLQSPLCKLPPPSTKITCQRPPLPKRQPELELELAPRQAPTVMGGLCLCKEAKIGNLPQERVYRTESVNPFLEPFHYFTKYLSYHTSYLWHGRSKLR